MENGSGSLAQRCKAAKGRADSDGKVRAGASRKGAKPQRSGQEMGFPQNRGEGGRPKPLSLMTLLGKGGLVIR